MTATLFDLGGGGRPYAAVEPGKLHKPVTTSKFAAKYGGDTKTEWLTDPAFLEKLGPFDLDPCAPVVRPWPMARHHFTIEDDGYAQDWSPFGRVWLNPPYQEPENACVKKCKKERCKERGWHANGYIPGTIDWMGRLVEHERGTALIFARTETDVFFTWVWDHADGLLFTRGRLAFYHVDGRRGEMKAGAPSVFIAYGDEDYERLRGCDIPGKFIDLRRQRS